MWAMGREGGPTEPGAKEGHEGAAQGGRSFMVPQLDPGILSRVSFLVLHFIPITAMLPLPTQPWRFH